MARRLSTPWRKPAGPSRLAIVAAVCCLLHVGIPQAGPDDAEQTSESASETQTEATRSPLPLHEPAFNAFKRVPGTVIKPLHDGIPLRESAPGFLGLYGREIDKTKEGDLYLLTEGKLMQHFFRNSVWIKIVPIPKTEDGESEKNKGYWAYWGYVDQDTEPNFVAVVPSELNDMNENTKGWVSNFQHQLQRQF